MEFRFRHVVEYKTDEKVPIEDVAHSLLAVSRSIRETPDLLCQLIDGLRIERVEVGLEEAEEGSLREVFWGIVFVTWQDDLTKEVPDLINKLFGYDVPDSADTVVTVASVVIVFYATEFIYRRLVEKEPAHLKRQLDGLISDLAERMGVSEDRVRRTLSEKYDQNRLRSLASMVSSFFRPGKGAVSHPMQVGKYDIGKEVVAEVPRAIDENRLPQKRNINVYNTVVDVVAEDLHSPNRWAAVINEVSPARRPLRVKSPVNPEDVYTRRFFRGDVTAVMEIGSNGELYPLEYHLTRVDP
jgi:hypothetical protein